MVLFEAYGTFVMFLSVECLVFFMIFSLLTYCVSCRLYSLSVLRGCGMLIARVYPLLYSLCYLEYYIMAEV